MIVAVVHHVAVPKRIVGEDESARSEYAHHHLVAVAVGTLVAIHKRHIEGDAEFWGLLKCIADDKLNLVGHLRALYPRACEVFHLIVDLEGIELSVVRKTLCHRDGAVAAEGAYLKDMLRLYHPNEHLEQSSLNVPTGHPSVDGVHVRRPP